MSYAAHRKDFDQLVSASPATSPHAPAPGRRKFVRRLLDRMFEPSSSQLEREMGEWFARSGGCLTDDLERQMMQHIIRSGSGTWR